MKVKPLGFNYAVVPVDNWTKRYNGSENLLVPEGAKPSQRVVKIVAKGKGGYTDPERYKGFRPPTFDVGDYVLVRTLSGTQVVVDGKKIWIIHESDVILKLSELPEDFKPEEGYYE